VDIPATRFVCFVRRSRSIRMNFVMSSSSSALKTDQRAVDRSAETIELGGDLDDDLPAVLRSLR
jgi:hypothetical protein